jgi:hypothetical protein
VLAYLFWHRPSPDAVEYERRLAEFHERLRADPPPGFVRSVVYSVDVPWMGRAYEDWYVVEDWAALGVLNAAAVDDSHRPEHDAVAGHAAQGAGGVYRFVGGELALEEVASVQWSAERPGAPDGIDHALWQRQMVLGPAPEFCLLTRAQGDVSRVVPPATQSRDHEL